MIKKVWPYKYRHWSHFALGFMCVALFREGIPGIATGSVLGVGFWGYQLIQERNIKKWDSHTDLREWLTGAGVGAVYIWIRSTLGV